MGAYRIKLADTQAEREQIHELNYRTFVEEIPQHAPNAPRRLIDSFDSENEYIVAVAGDGSVVGMLALRAARPFSLDRKLTDLDRYLPPHRSVCELRLLAVRPEHRRRRLLRDLLAFAARRCLEAGHDLAVISGTTRQLEFYEHLGFEPFGPLLGTDGARYQPMHLLLERFIASVGGALGLEREGARRFSSASFLPGPVTMGAPARAAFGGAVLSHRSTEFMSLVGEVRRMLRELTGAGEVALLPGSGTLANDIVASSIAARGERGLVLSNGEFGERLTDHARRAALPFEVLRRPWGTPFEEGEVLNSLRRLRAGWLWAVHCETSTGVLNDLGMLRSLGAGAGADVYLDCVSSIGSVEVDLAGVRLASCSSGKGLGAYPGLAAVLLDSRPPRQCARVPRYLDLQLWLDAESVPFTHCSPLIAALHAALSATDWQRQLQRAARDARWLRTVLRARGLRVLAPERVASPGVTTIELPRTAPSPEVAALLGRAGLEVAWRSAYLTERNWIQIALMGVYDGSALRALPDVLARAVGASSSACGRIAAGRAERSAVPP